MNKEYLYLLHLLKSFIHEESPHVQDNIDWKKYFCNIGLFNKRSIQMQQEHIDHILFKGYVIKDYYPIPELRSYGGIDFVIRLEDREKSHQLMLSQVFQDEGDLGESCA